jgi:hypothetical protein
MRGRERRRQRRVPGKTWPWPLTQRTIFSLELNALARVLVGNPNTEEIMRSTLTAATVAAFLAGTALAFAQTTAPSAQTTAPSANDRAPSNPAVKTTQGNNPGAPAAGANSFTEGQAKSRIESRGYANVSGLAKDTNGFWRGTAMKDGKTVNVTLDYQGNVTVN